MDCAAAGAECPERQHHSWSRAACKEREEPGDGVELGGHIEAREMARKCGVVIKELETKQGQCALEGRQVCITGTCINSRYEARDDAREYRRRAGVTQL